MPRGRKPQPTAVKEISGAFKKTPHRRNASEPTPPPGSPDCPDYLCDLAKIEWWYMCGVLDEMGLLSRADRAALEIYCQTFAQWREACQMVAKEGAVVQMQTTAGSIAKRNPLDILRERTAATCSRLLAEFGLTPSSRSRVQVEKKSTDDFADFLRASSN